MYNVSIKMSFMTLYICEHTIWISFTTEYLAISLCQMRRTHFWTQMNVSLYFPINVHIKIIHQDIRYQSWSDRIWFIHFISSPYSHSCISFHCLLCLPRRERERARETDRDRGRECRGLSGDTPRPLPVSTPSKVPTMARAAPPTKSHARRWTRR